MKIFTKVILLSSVSVLAATSLHAQTLSDKFKRKHHNDCLEYFREVKDTAKAVLKSVALTRYLSDDSLMTNKRFGGKTMRTFDDIGQETFEMNVDSNMTVTDSERIVFNSKHDLVRDSKYEIDDSTHRMKATKEEFVSYNKEGKEMVDSTIENNRYTAYNERKASGIIMVRHNVYNSNGDADRMVMTSNRDMLMMDVNNDNKEHWDTVTVYMKYDNKHRVICTSVDVMGISEKEYVNYDDQDREIFSARVALTDSSAESKAYDKKGNIMWDKSYKNGAITYNERISTDKAGNHIDTIERYTPARGLQCANNELEVKISDTADNTLLLTTTSQKNNQPFIHSIRHIYTFNSKGKITSDSTITSDQGHLYTELTEEVTNTTYDKNGDPTEELNRGGGQYNSNGRAEWTYNAKHHVLEMKRFNSCVADKPTYSYSRVYYPDGESLKQGSYFSGYSTNTVWYSLEGMETREDNINHYAYHDGGNYTETVYEYKK